MPCTALQIEKEGKINRLKFITQQQPGFLELLVYLCDEDFKPVGNPEHSAHELSEEHYHRDLRKASKEKGHYVPEESTNPEWNQDETTLQSSLPG
jgi:hypothetical protein